MYPNAKEENWPAKAKLSKGVSNLSQLNLGKIVSDGLRGYICTVCGKIITEAHHIKPENYAVRYQGQIFYMERHVCDPCMKKANSWLCKCVVYSSGHGYTLNSGSIEVCPTCETTRAEGKLIEE